MRGSPRARTVSDGVVVGFFGVGVAARFFGEEDVEVDLRAFGTKTAADERGKGASDDDSAHVRRMGSQSDALGRASANAV